MMKSISIKEAAQIVSGKLIGDENLRLSGIASLSDATSKDISFAVNERLKEKVERSKAGAFLLPENWPNEINKPAILVKDPYLGYALLAQYFFDKPFEKKGIHQSAVIGKGCEISENVSIGPNVVIGNNVKIEGLVTIHPGVVIGNNCKIGEGSEIFPNVVIYEGCRIGKRVRIHGGAVIGADGFGYAQGPHGMVKIPQVGTVIIEDDVEIGANSTIDRAAFGETRIGKGTKIDNLVMIAHNCQIGAHCAIVSQVGISGSTKVGSGVMLAGQVGIVGHIEIGDGVKVGAKSGVPNSVPAGQIVSGIPAMPHRKWLRVINSMKRLPELIKDVRNIKKALERLQKDDK